MQALLPAARLHLARGDHELARATAPARPAGARRRPAAGGRAADGARRRRARRRRPRGGRRRRAPSSSARADGVDVPSLAGAGGGGAGPGAGRRRRATPTRWRCSRRRSTRSTPASCRGCGPRCCVELARAAAARGDRAAAAVDAAAAPAALAELDVVRRAGDAALLGRPRARAGRGRDLRHGRRWRDGGTWWTAPATARRVRLPDTQGPALPRRAGRATRAPSATPSTSSTASRASSRALDRRALSATPARCSTTQARAAYRRRIEAAAGRGRRRARAADRSRTPRRDARPSSTSSSASWPGRSGSAAAARRAGSAAERARLNVTRALRAAIAKLAEALPGGRRGARPRASAPACTAPTSPADGRRCAGSFSPD